MHLFAAAAGTTLTRYLLAWCKGLCRAEFLARDSSEPQPIGGSGRWYRLLSAGPAGRFGSGTFRWSWRPDLKPFAVP